MSVASFRRSQGFRNPDEDFVLHGRPSSFWEKPAYLNNSQITNSSIRLTSKHTMFNPEKYSDRHYVKSLGDIANNLGNLSANLNRSVSFSNKLQSKGISNNSASKFIDTEEELSRLRSQTSDLSFRGHPLRENENDWLNTANTMMSQRIASNYKTSYPYEGEMDKEKEYTGQEKTEYPLSTRDSLSLRFFPVTMSAPYELSYIDSNVPSTKIHNIRPKSAPRLTSKPGKSKSMVGPFTRSDVDKMFLMSSEAPVTGASSKVITSPYQSEIAKLRMERLRIEEDRLLELKRHEEIERIRGPNHRWYESKGPDFHYECSKNTEMMKHEDHWEELVDYRNSLMECSTAFRKSYGAFA
ncbi:uncharacterized protein LOC110456400 isoform X1 [Mizuhopecten yessoensis]|uniref:Uncharacterized protein n=1 Tax=Mizuhopecten yessoensis TaxID=6573 RepID=A0A210QAV5_MIZYE|nr:uncharacterized protein LOC110456400 isoform X1 [Mizuhopecten yessoensis]OWF45859.1 hypothetical protein KP79_PYT07257 [Mizuhopecten yessoensis]